MTQEHQTPIIIYDAANTAVEVRLDTDQETVWLSQRQMADVFDTSTDNIGLHLKNIYADDELLEEATTEESSVLRQEGQRQVRRHVKHYNFHAIISFGCRVNSGRAVKFRRWVNRPTCKNFLPVQLESELEHEATVRNFWMVPQNG
ncbi:virulence RhuM family protein [Ectothiorhodospira sp. B14B]|nr:RhuM family protein [Ectothiorhodospira lacustris]MCG5501882.1 virulence RhuM family protein [Ectothiorhodospira lacustris]